MLSVNLTQEQLNLLYELASEKFEQITSAWLPVEETKEMRRLSYDTIVNLRAVREAAEFDNTYANWDKDFWNFDKAQYLKEVHLVPDEALQQQGIK